jgi:DNA-binding transcriptional LysR family regulator
VVCPQDHPLAKKRVLHVADLVGHEVIHLAKSSSVRQHVEILLREVQVIHSGFEVEHLATVAGLVKQGLGISVVPELTLFQFRQLDLVAIPLHSEGLVRPILIVRRKDQSLSVAAQAMLALIEKRLGQTANPRKYKNF